MSDPDSPPRDLLEESFASALELVGDARERYLDQVCGVDAALRAELGELLAAHAESERYFDRLSGDIATAAESEIESAAKPQLVIGPYRASRLIGHGGMGAVYLGARVDGEFEQIVALKLLHLDMEIPEARARFLVERQLLARLAHPNIARLYDGGVTAEGRPYFAMEYVEGMPIDRFCTVRQRTIEDTIRLFLAVIGAVSYLHRNLIVHRDLKPSNILVTEAGEVKLLDFGIAKLLGPQAEDGGVTRTGQQLLTPRYAAPEQLAGGVITTATDVWALGVVLYELLTGSRPFEETAPHVARPLEANPPSSRRRGISRDLDTICTKALQVDPNQRYASAEQLGQDLERYLEGLPIRARPSTWSYRLARFVRRHRVGVAVVTLLFALIAAGLLGERRLRSEAEAARSVAQQESAKAVAVSDFLAELLSSVEPSKAQGRDVAVADVLAEASQRLEAGDAFRDQPAVASALHLTIGRTYSALRRFEQAKPHLERALELRGGPTVETAEALEALAALGTLEFRAERREEAEQILGQVLRRRTALLGEEHSATLESLGDLADLYWYQRRLDEVEVLDRRLVEVRTRVLGPDHPQTLRALNGLATTLYSLGRYAEAAERFAQAYAGLDRQLGSDHPETLRLANNLGSALSATGRYADAEGPGRKAMEGRRRVLGEHHPETATAVQNLGLIIFRLGRFEEAEALLVQAIEARSDASSLGAYWYSKSWLAEIYRAQGRQAKARALLVDSIAGLVETDGPTAPATLRAEASLASLDLEEGRIAEAQRVVERVLAAQTEVLGAEHPDTLESRYVLAEVRQAQGRLGEALGLAREVHAISERTRSPGHPETGRAAELVARLEQEAGPRPRPPLGE